MFIKEKALPSAVFRINARDWARFHQTSTFVFFISAFAPVAPKAKRLPRLGEFGNAPLAGLWLGGTWGKDYSRAF